MNLSDYGQYDGLGLAKLVRSGEASPDELRRAALEASASINSRIGAIVETWSDELVGALDGPFAGVPFVVKDLGVAVKGRANELGSRLATGLIAGADSNLMDLFRRAGLTPIGRATTPEFAISTTTEPAVTGPTRNPWDLARSAGGSSGGSAAAVAAGIVPIGHATDGGGSIRVPASSTGLFGLKPTRGRVSNGPGVDEIWSGLAVQLAVTRTVRDSAALLDAVHGRAIGEPYLIAPPDRAYQDHAERDPKRLRIGVMPHPLNGARSADPVAAAVGAAAELLGDLGHDVEDVVLDPGVSWEAFVHASAQIWTANTAAWVSGIARATGRPIDRTTLEPATLAAHAYGQRVSGVDLIGALDVRNTVTRALGVFFSRHDILLSPTVPEAPPLIGTYNAGQEEMDGLSWVTHVFDQSPFTALFNMGGTPAMSVPLAVDPVTGLPIGLQFAAGFGREDILFGLAGQLERAAPWAARRPSVFVGSASGAG